MAPCSLFLSLCNSLSGGRGSLPYTWGCLLFGCVCYVRRHDRLRACRVAADRARTRALETQLLFLALWSQHGSSFPFWRVTRQSVEMAAIRRTLEGHSHVTDCSFISPWKRLKEVRELDVCSLWTRSMLIKQKFFFFFNYQQQKATYRYINFQGHGWYLSSILFLL